MAEGGFDEENPLMKHTDDDDNDDDDGEENQNPFSPSGSFKPRRQDEWVGMKTRQKEKSGMQKPDKSYAETSFGGRSGLTIEDTELIRRYEAFKNDETYIYSSDKAENYFKKLTEEGRDTEIQELRGILENNGIEDVKEFIKKRYPEVDFSKMGKGIRFATANEAAEKTGIKSTDIVVVGTRGGLTKILLDDGSAFQSKFLNMDFVKRALGKPAEKLYNEKLEKLSKDIDANKKIADDGTKSETERKNARELAKRLIDEREKINELKAGVEKPSKSTTGVNKPSKSTTGPSESLTFKEFQQNQEQRQERQKEIQKEREEQQEIANDENEDPAVRQQAREKIEELDDEENQIENENRREIERLSFRERAKVKLKNAWEKIKEFFKKNGVTLLSITIAAGITIGVVTDILTDALKSIGKALGNGLKAIAKKTASLLPGLIGSIVSFLFKAAGQAIGFLAEHTWLLILAVVAFLVEGQIKKQR